MIPRTQPAVVAVVACLVVVVVVVSAGCEALNSRGSARHGVARSGEERIGIHNARRAAGASLRCTAAGGALPSPVPRRGVSPTQ